MKGLTNFAILTLLFAFYGDGNVSCVRLLTLFANTCIIMTNNLELYYRKLPTCVCGVYFLTVKKVSYKLCVFFQNLLSGLNPIVGLHCT